MNAKILQIFEYLATQKSVKQKLYTLNDIKFRKIASSSIIVDIGIDGSALHLIDAYNLDTL